MYRCLRSLQLLFLEGRNRRRMLVEDPVLLQTRKSQQWQ
jgi:hypothetical protein